MIDNANPPTDDNDQRLCAAVFVKCDVANPHHFRKLCIACIRQFGSVDIIMLNAGITEPKPYGFFDSKPEQWKKVIDINLVSVIECTQIAVNEFLRDKDSVIVITASIAGTVPQPETPVYAATKAGVVNFVRSVSWMHQQTHVRINAVCPHFTLTPLVCNKLTRRHNPF